MATRLKDDRVLTPDTPLDEAAKTVLSAHLPNSLFSCLRRYVTKRVYFENRSFSSSGLSWSLTQSRSATA